MKVGRGGVPSGCHVSLACHPRRSLPNTLECNKPWLGGGAQGQLRTSLKCRKSEGMSQQTTVRRPAHFRVAYRAYTAFDLRGSGAANGEQRKEAAESKKQWLSVKRLSLRFEQFGFF